jgi:hypothetical protein
LNVIIREEVEMRRLILVPLFLVISLAMATPNTHAAAIKLTFVFADHFPADAESLGASRTGNLLQVGAFIVPGDSPIKEVTAKNLDTGLVLKLNQIKLGPIYRDLLYEATPFPYFDPSKHKGVWEIRVKDESGKEAIAKTHRLDKEEAMPFVRNIQASGNQLAPAITWDAPKEEDIPAGCEIRYQVRLIKHVLAQFYKSKKPQSDTKHEIPEGFLTPEDIADTFIRIECQCLEAGEEEHGKPLELRSETFQSLKEALGQ